MDKTTTNLSLGNDVRTSVQNSETEAKDINSEPLQSSLGSPEHKDALKRRKAQQAHGRKQKIKQKVHEMIHEIDLLMNLSQHHLDEEDLYEMVVKFNGIMSANIARR